MSQSPEGSMAASNGNAEKNRMDDVRTAEEDLEQASDAVPLRCELVLLVLPHYSY